jgi:biopolymer transport protein ExbD
MALRKKKRHISEVNMSSMTDIIFMLLIFFMLTSTLVKYFPFKLPESDQRTTGNIKTTISVDKAGRFQVNNQSVPFINLEATLRAALANTPEGTQPTVTIAAETGVPFEQVTKLMAVANRLKARTVLATAPRE